MSSHVIQTIQAHRSIRKFLPDPLPQDLLDDILQTATRAATSGNMQFYSIIVTTDPSLRKELYKVHREQDMILQAPVLLTYCADLHRITQWMALNGAKVDFKNTLSLMRGVVDVCLVAQNVALAAESEGLGICYMGTTLTAGDQISDILGIPELVIPVTSMVLGYPAESPEIIERLPGTAVLHRERYEPFDQRRISLAYSDRDKKSLRRFSKSPKWKSKVEAGEVQNAPQIYAQDKYNPESLKALTKTLESVIEKKWGLSISSQNPK